MKVLLLGGNGQLGRTFLRTGELAARGELTVSSRDGALHGGHKGVAIDMARPNRLPPVLDSLHPDVIVNTSAYTAVDRAEQEEELALRVNGEAIGTIGRWAAQNGALVIHFSTDYVFDGLSRTPYPVDAPRAPVGAYGRSKLAGEQALGDSGANHLIFRTAWVYASHGQNFLRTMLRLGAERDELKVVDDQHGTPTSTGLIVEGSLAALDAWWRSTPEARRDLIGTHHLVASGSTTWHGFASRIFEEALDAGILKRAPRIVPVTTAEFPTPARRPAWSVLDNTDYQRRFDHSLPDWQLGLHHVIHELSNETA